MEKELRLYKDLNTLRTKTLPDSAYFVLNSATQKVNQIWVTNNQNVPKKVELTGIISAQDLISIQDGNRIYISTVDGKLQVNTIVSPDLSLEVVNTATQLQLQLSAGLLTQINSALQSGDNVSELVNDIGYLTDADMPNATSIKREEFTYSGGSQIFTLLSNYYQVFSIEVQAQGALSESQYSLILPNQVEILDTLNIGDYIVILYGEDFFTTAIPYYTKAEVDALKVAKVAGERLINASEIAILSNTSGTNTGDETASTIVTKIGDGSKINQSYLPSYVDDILEFDTVALFPIVGEIGKIYIVTTGVDINKQYRWTGSGYTQITNGLIASTNDVPEGINNLYFTTNRVLATLINGVSLITGGIISATDSILISLGKLQKQITDNNSNAIKNIIKDAVPTVPITGTLTETIFNSYLIPANTFSANDMMKIPYFEMSKVGATTGGSMRIYVNTSNTLIGAVQIARYAFATSLYAKITRQFNINEGALTGFPFTSNNIITDINITGLTFSSTPFNPAIDNYIITTGQLSLATESIQQRGFCVTN